MLKALRPFMVVATLSFIISACMDPKGSGGQPAGIDGGSPGELDCVVRTQTYNVHLSSYQERKDSSAEVFENLCQDVPATGKTYFVVDLVSADKKIRNMPVAFRLVEEAAPPQKDAVPAVLRTLREIPAQIYKTGIMEMQVDFDRPGHYALFIDTGGLASADVVRVPLRVGVRAPFRLDWKTSVLLIGLVLTAFGFFAYHHLKAP